MAADNKTSVVITAIDATKEGFTSAEAGLQSLAGRFISLTNPITAASLAIGAAAGAIGLSVRSAIDTGDSFNKLSQKTGIAVESLSALAYAGTLSDVSLESLATGIKKLSVNLNEAATATGGKAADAFRVLGVSITESSGALRSSESVMSDIADRFAGMKDGAVKTALAVALFGKAGADLIPFLNQGSKGIAELTAEAEKLGLIMTGKTAKAAEEFNDNIKKLSLSTAALGRSIAADLIGPLAEYTRLMVEARKEGSGLFGSVAIGLRTGGAEIAPLQDLRDRAGSLQGTISFLTQGGQRPNDPVFGGKLKAAEAELAILQKIIAKRLKEAEDFGPPALPAEKKDAPVFGEKEKKVKADTALDRMLALGQKNLYGAIDSEEEQRILAEKRAMHEALQEYQDLQRMIKKGEENELAQYYETAGEETMRLVAHQRELKDATKDSFSEMSKAIESWGNKAADTFADFVVDGKASFTDLVNSFLKDIVRIQAKKFIDPITTQAGDWLAGAIGGAFGTGSGSGVALAAGGVMSGAGISAFSGSVVSRPTLFPFANGIGLMGEAGAEAILPLRRGANGKLGVQAGGSGVTVNIIEDSSRGGQVQARRGENGQNLLDVFVDRVRAAVAGDIASGSGAIPAALGSTYGLNRAAGGY